MNKASELQHFRNGVVFSLTARLDRGSLWIAKQKVLSILDVLRSISSVHFCRGGHVSMTFFFPPPKALSLKSQLSCLCFEL